MSIRDNISNFLRINDDGYFHQNGYYYHPLDLFTPEEIVESGFALARTPAFLYDCNDKWNLPKESTSENSFHVKPIVVKTVFWKGGHIRSVEDYFNNKDMFKPLIVESMKKAELHYIHRVSMNRSPLDCPPYIFYPISIRGCKFPKVI